MGSPAPVASAKLTAPCQRRARPRNRAFWASHSRVLNRSMSSARPVSRSIAIATDQSVYFVRSMPMATDRGAAGGAPAGRRQASMPREGERSERPRSPSGRRAARPARPLAGAPAGPVAGRTATLRHSF